MSRSFLAADVQELVRRLKVDEKIALLGAPNWWNTTPIERLEIPSIRMSDGPNGVRGSSHFASVPGQCLPCATALASTFDTELIHAVGELLGDEAIVKGAIVLLAPTCNIQRSPLGGRAFESFSEDPHLSGLMSAAYINGLQSKGVAATIKHFVANDQEFERCSADSVMTDRALREIYLYPFMLAQKKAQPWAFMTSYGRINNIHCSENKELLQGILRDEWGFKGIVISDWTGTYSLSAALNAGLDLEMPGPPKWRTAALASLALTSGKLLVPTLNERVTTMLEFLQQQARRHPEIVYGDGKEGSRDSPEVRNFCRRVAADSIVLLKNDHGLLPFQLSKIKRLLVVGPNAKERIISGGGSAALKATYTITPFEGILQAADPDLTVDYHIGCYAHKYLPTLEKNLTAHTGEPGWLCTFYKHDKNGNVAEEVANFIVTDTRIKLNDFIPAGLTPTWTLKVTGELTFDKTAQYELGLTVAGRAKLFINGELTIDNWTKQRLGDFFYGQGTIEEKATVSMTAGKSVDVLVEYTNTPSAELEAGEKGDGVQLQPALMRGVRFGGCEKLDPEKTIEAAATLAAKADAVVFVAGLTPEWESEGFDRPSLELPGLQNQAISCIAQANSNTVVVVQCGSAISMPWVSSVNSILYTWYLGNETGSAIADILFGKVNPSGRLSLTFPAREQDIPAYPLGGENGKVYYHEDLFVGYKHYLARNIKPLFPFGFGLSYTEFSLSDASLTAPSSVDPSLSLQISVTVKNQGPMTGSQTVQVYITYPNTEFNHPSMQLKGFAKAKDIAVGSSATVMIELDKYAFSFWDTRRDAWRVSPGTYLVHVGFSSAAILKTLPAKINGRGFHWTGL